jgi:hypothetical protein
MITPNLSLQEAHRLTGEFLQTLSPHTPTNLISLELNTVQMHKLVAKTDETPFAAITKVMDTLKDVSRRLEALTSDNQLNQIADAEVNRLGLRVNDAISDLEDLLT